MSGLTMFLLIVNCSSGLLMAALAVPLIRRKVGRNLIYGFRVRQTLADPEVWYEANAFAGRCLYRAGVGIILASLALYFWPAIDPMAYAWSCLAISLGGVAGAVFPSFRHLRRLANTEEPPGQRPSRIPS